jgi:hypothetical protein
MLLLVIGSLKLGLEAVGTTERGFGVHVIGRDG